MQLLDGYINLETYIAPRRSRKRRLAKYNSARFPLELMQRILRVMLSLIVFALGAIYAWNARDFMNPDGISYLDVGDACLQGNARAINGLWSPFYPCLLGAAMRLIKPSVHWEFPIVHLVNFAIYLFALWAFDFLLCQLIRYHKERKFEDGLVTLPAWAWVVLGYLLFIVCSLHFTLSPLLVTPDSCVAALVFFASGILVRIRRGSSSWLMFVLLGIALGLGYLSKLAMFPLALVFLSIAAFSTKNLKTAVTRTLIASFAFFLVASLYFVPLSVSKGRVTFGDAARLNYAWYLNDVTWHVHWQGEPPGNGTPIHPTRKIFEQPAIHEFASPIGGTYPPWFDPSYWYEGVTPRFDLARQIRTLRQSAFRYLWIFSSKTQISLFAGLLAMCFIGYHRRLHLMRNMLQQWNLLAPSLAAFFVYLFISVESRYIGMFMVLLWLGLYSGARLAECGRSKKWMAAITIAVASVMVLSVVQSTLPVVTSLARELFTGESSDSKVLNARTPGVIGQAQIAESLNKMGVRPGDSVASIGNGFSCGWARLARVRIIAEITNGSPLRPATQDVEAFWAADSTLKMAVIKKFTDTGARAIVTDNVPGWASSEGWQQIGNTGYHVYFLNRTDSNNTSQTTRLTTSFR